MRTVTVTLIADDTPASIATLGALTAKFKNVLLYRIYAESGNDVDPTNGPARIGGSDVDRVAAGGVKGEPIIPGITNIYPPAGIAGIYDFAHIYLTGKTGDVFQIAYWVL